MQRRRLLTIGAAFILSMLMYLCSLPIARVPTAQAHAFVIGSDPVDGSTIQKLPDAVRISFDAPISTLSSAHVYLIRNGGLNEVSDASGSVVATDPHELVVPITRPTTQVEGSYEVAWTAVASADGRTTDGIIGFNVGFSSTGASSGTAILGPSSSNNLSDLRTLDTMNLIAIFWDWLALGALVFWAGMLMVELLLQTDTGRNAEVLARTRKQTRSLQWLCLAVLLCAEIVSLCLRTTSLQQTGHNTNNTFSSLLIQLVSTTTYGHYWMLRLALLGSAMAVLYWFSQKGPYKPSTEAVQYNVRVSLARQQLHQTETVGPQVSSRYITRQLPETVATTTQRYTKALLDTPSHPPAARITKTTSDFNPTPSALRCTLLELLLAALIMGTYALSSEAAQVFQPHLSAILFTWLSLVAQCMWLGGLAYFGYVLPPLFTGTTLDYHNSTQIALLKRLTPFFLAGIGILLATYFFLCETSIHDPGQWLTDPYGRTLLVQIGLLAVMLLLSLYALFIQAPRLTRQALFLPVVDAELPTRRTRQLALSDMGRGLRRVSIAVTLLGCGFLLCSALLSHFAPPIVFPDIDYSKLQTTTQGTTGTDMQTQQIGDFKVSLQTLRRPDAYTLIVFVEDVSGKAINDAQVHLTTNMQAMDMGTASQVATNSGTFYSTTFAKEQTFNMDGLWNISVSIQRPGLQAEQGTFQIQITS